jgi:death-on-curing protein
MVVDAVHLDQLREHGGLAGLRDEKARESALARPRQKWHYRKATDLPRLAAAYGLGLCKNHPYRDGNKRVAFVVMVTFLGLNGLIFEADEAEVVTVMLALAGRQRVRARARKMAQRSHQETEAWWSGLRDGAPYEWGRAARVTASSE